MRLSVQPGHVIEVVLSRRNLLALLLKLDEAESAKTLMKVEPDGVLVVKAEDDEDHYDGRMPGVMHPREEARL